MPCTPNPTTGFFFYVPRREIIELDIPVEEAAKLIMTAGMIQPGGGGPGDAEKNSAAPPQPARTSKASPALAPPPQISLGDAEAVLGIAQDREPRRRGLGERRLVEQQARRALAAAADAAAQLVQLREPESLGVLDPHHGRLRDVDADFDHG